MKSREEVIASLDPDSSQIVIARRLDDRARDGETVALRLNADQVSYPFFDGGFDRRVVFVDGQGGLDADVDWLVVAPRLDVERCPAGWRRETAEAGWRLYRRVGLCPGESAAS
jgi:hypothetical protein